MLLVYPVFMLASTVVTPDEFEKINWIVQKKTSFYITELSIPNGNWYKTWSKMVLDIPLIQSSMEQKKTCWLVSNKA